MSNYQPTPDIVTKRPEEEKNNTIDSAIVAMTCDNQFSTGRYLYMIFHSLMSMIAIYLSFRCNGKFRFSSFIMALLFPYLYIIYVLATQGTCGIMSSCESKTESA